MMTPCPICDTQRQHVFDATILGRHQVAYYLCSTCGLLQTETPFWLDEAYTEAIANADTGLVARNQAISRKLAGVAYFLLDRNGSYHDTAGGYGLLVRLMRDIGFDFRWSDEYCRNLFAIGFAHDNSQPSCTAVTAFEVIEHLQDPLGFIREKLEQNRTSTIIFTTELYSGSPPAPADWWYYALDTGQHISFLCERTLQTIAGRLGLRLYSNRHFHMLTEHRHSAGLFRLLTGPASWLSWLWVMAAMRSRTMADHRYICEHNRSSRDT